MTGDKGRRVIVFNMRDFNGNICVWYHFLKLPKLLTEKINCYSKKVIRYNIDCWRPLPNLELIVCNRDCYWHDDREITKKYSLLYVVRNDSNSYVHSRGYKVEKNQPIGTFIFLNVWEEHKLSSTLNKNGIWMALFKDFDKPISSKKFGEKIIRELI